MHLCIGACVSMSEKLHVAHGALHLCVCVCVCVCVHIIHVYVYINVQEYICIYTNVQVYA